MHEGFIAQETKAVSTVAKRPQPPQLPQTTGTSSSSSAPPASSNATAAPTPAEAAVWTKVRERRKIANDRRKAANTGLEEAENPAKMLATENEPTVTTIVMDAGRGFQA